MPPEAATVPVTRELPTPVRAVLVVGLLYVFLVGVALLEVGIAGLGEGFTTGLLDRVANPLSGLFAGLLFTVLVHSSSITTSILIPMVAAGVLTLRNAYPITLGANVGTTITALLASLAVLRPEGLTIALVHTLFNLLAIAIIYPVRSVRNLPVRAAVWTAETATKHRTLVLAYALGLFIVIPVLGVLLLG